MKRQKVILLVAALLSMTSLGGCIEYLAGAGAGAATVETVQTWQDKLSESKAALQEQYTAAVAALERGPDPNTAAELMTEIRGIQAAESATDAALLAVESFLAYPGDGDGGDRKDFWLSSAIGAGLLGLQYLKKRRTEVKLSAFKAGHASLNSTNPQAGAELYQQVKLERNARGLS